VRGRRAEPAGAIAPDSSAVFKYRFRRQPRQPVEPPGGTLVDGTAASPQSPPRFKRRSYSISRRSLLGEVDPQSWERWGGASPAPHSDRQEGNFVTCAPPFFGFNARSKTCDRKRSASHCASEPRDDLPAGLAGHAMLPARHETQIATHNVSVERRRSW